MRHMVMQLLRVDMVMDVMVTMVVCPWVCKCRVHLVCCLDMHMDMDILVILGICRRIHRRMDIRISISCRMDIMRIRMRR